MERNEGQAVCETVPQTVCPSAREWHEDLHSCRTPRCSLLSLLIGSPFLKQARSPPGSGHGMSWTVRAMETPTLERGRVGRLFNHHPPDLIHQAPSKYRTERAGQQSVCTHTT